MFGGKDLPLENLLLIILLELISFTKSLLSIEGSLKENFVFPFKFGELGNDFKLENGVYYPDGDYTLYDMYNSKDYICTIAIEGDKTDNNSDKKVVLVDVKSPENDHIRINGLDYKTSIEDFVSSFGETSIKTESYLEYKKGNIILSLIFDNTKSELSNIMLIEEKK